MRRRSKPSRRKHTFRNKPPKNRTTRKVNTLMHVGGLRLFPTSTAKTRWGKRIEKLVIQKMLEKSDGEVLNQVLSLPNREPNDIPSRFYTDPATGAPTNLSIKAKKTTDTAVKTIDTGLPTNVLDSIRDRAQYHMIFVNYTVSGNHADVDSTLRLDLKKLFHPLISKFTNVEMNVLYEDIQKASNLIKSKKDDEGRALCAVITRRIASKSTTQDIVWKINPKISSSNHRIQGGLTINFDSPLVKSCIIRDTTFDSLSPAESDEGISPHRWMNREGQISVKGTVRPTPKSSVSARSAQDLLEQSPVVKLKPRASVRSRKPGSSFSQKQIEELMVKERQFKSPTTKRGRGQSMDHPLSRIHEDMD